MSLSERSRDVIREFGTEDSVRFRGLPSRGVDNPVNKSPPFSIFPFSKASGKGMFPVRRSGL